jgi:hypothetical protein
MAFLQRPGGMAFLQRPGLSIAMSHPWVLAHRRYLKFEIRFEV